MGRQLLKVILFRALLVAAPFAMWFIWREIARRTGRPMGATPWAWLIAAGAALLGISLLVMVLFQGDHRGERYVPAEVGPGGKVGPARFETVEPETP